MNENEICTCICHIEEEDVTHCDPCCSISMFGGGKYLDYDGTVDMEKYKQCVDEIEFRLKDEKLINKVYRF
jgi:hypothetical protein